VHSYNPLIQIEAPQGQAQAEESHA
jgi:hypothetical protein